MERHPNNGDRQGKENLETNTKRPIENSPTSTNHTQKSKVRVSSSSGGGGNPPNDLQYQYDLCRDFSEAIDMFRAENLSAIIKLDGLIADIQDSGSFTDFDQNLMNHYENFKSCVDNSIAKLINHQESYDACASNIVDAMKQIGQSLKDNRVDGGLKDKAKSVFNKAKNNGK